MQAKDVSLAELREILSAAQRGELIIRLHDGQAVNCLAFCYPRSDGLRPHRANLPDLRVIFNIDEIQHVLLRDWHDNFFRFRQSL